MKRYRWVILCLLFSATFVNYIDRASLSIAAPYIMKDFDLTPASLGVLFSAFSMTYAVFCFVGGYLGDVLGPKKTIAISMAVWSVFAGAPAIAWGFAALIVFRLCFGAAEGPISSVSNKMVNNWFPITERAKAKGITDAGMSAGAAVASPIVGLVAVAWGWRVSFALLTVIGIIWVLFWCLLTTDSPKNHPRVSPEELAEINRGKVAPTAAEASRSLGYYMKQPVIITTMLAFFACNYATYFFLSWFPSYLVMARHLSIANMSIVGIIPWLGGAAGYAGGGYLSDYLVERIGDQIKARKIVISVFLTLAAASIALCGLATSAATAVTLMSFGIFFAYLTIPSYWAIIQDSVESGSVGRVGGCVHFLSNIAGIVAPSLTGFILQQTGLFTSAFLLTGGLAVVGAVLIALFAKAIPTRAIA